MWSCPLLSIHRSSFRPGWSGVLAKEVGGELKPEAPGIGAKGIEEGEEVLGAEDSVSQCKCQGRWNDTSAVLHHPRVWSPLHSRCLSRSVYNCLSLGLDKKHVVRSPGMPFYNCVSLAFALSLQRWRMKTQFQERKKLHPIGLAANQRGNRDQNAHS